MRSSKLEKFERHIPKSCQIGMVGLAQRLASQTGSIINRILVGKKTGPRMS